MTTQTKEQTTDVLRDYPVYTPFFFEHKRLIKIESGEVIEITRTPEENNKLMRNAMLDSFILGAQVMIRLGCQHNGLRCDEAASIVVKKIKCAIEGDYPKMWLNDQDVVLTRSLNGRYLEGLSSWRLAFMADQFCLMWDGECAEVKGVSESTDQLVLLILNLETQKFTEMKDCFMRGDETIFFDADNPEEHHEFMGWAFFVSACGKYVSQTFSLGVFSITGLKEE